MSTAEDVPKHRAALLALAQVSLISLPLFVYVGFWSLVVVPYKGPSDLWHKPEWMFIALMLQIEATRNSIEFVTHYSSRVTPTIRSGHLISYIVVLVIFVLVLFAALGSYEQAFEAGEGLHIVQWVMLGSAVFSCWRSKYRNIRFNVHA